MVRRNNSRRLLPVLIALAGLVTPHAGAADAPPAAAAAPKSRDFLFTYAATVTGLPAGGMARVWVPTPSDDADQTVTPVEQQLPARPHKAQEPKYGNRILYLEAQANAAGEIPLSLTYRVHRGECGVRQPAGPADAEQVKLFLRPDAKVPIGGKPATLIEGKILPTDPAALGRYFYDLVDDRMQYRKDKPGWGTGDAEWACDSRFGNCTDFHSLFISLARTSKLPAKFEIGFGIPEKRGAGDVPGYHCWAKFMPAASKGWIPVDISEANKHPEKREYFFGHLCENRVAFSVGRDLVLVPKQAGPPLNFFVYPYVEVDGQPWPAERVRKQFRYQDVEPADPADPPAAK